MSTATQTRLSKPDRRQQLLDCAAELLIDRGPAALTMEGLAVAAGVSKALPYSHFDNAEAVLVALYEREVYDLGATVLLATRSTHRGDDQMRAAVHAYFDFVKARGPVLGALSGSGSGIDRSLDPELGPGFVGQLLVDNYVLARPAAERIGELIIACLTAASAMWARGVASRRTIEATVVDFVLAGIHHAAATA